MRTLTKKIILSVGLSSLVFLGACKETERVLVQPATSESVASLPNADETVSGPVTHGGDVLRARARKIKQAFDFEIDFVNHRGMHRGLYSDLGVRAASYRFWSETYWARNVNVHIYERDFPSKAEALKRVFSQIYSGDHNIFSEIFNTPIKVKTFAPYDFSGSAEEYEDLYGTCTTTNKLGIEVSRTGVTEAKPYSEICIDAKILSKSNPSIAELVALVSGHEMVHHFGFEAEDEEVAVIQDFVLKYFAFFFGVENEGGKIRAGLGPDSFENSFTINRDSDVELVLDGLSLEDKSELEWGVYFPLWFLVKGNRGYYSGPTYKTIGLPESISAKVFVSDSEGKDLFNYSLIRKLSMENILFEKISLVIDGEVVWTAGSDFNNEFPMLVLEKEADE